MEWFLYGLMATVMFGIQSFLYKSSIVKNCNKFLVMLIFLLTVEIFSLVMFIFKAVSFFNLVLTIVLGLLFATAFYLKTYGQIKALEFLPTNKVFPITSSSTVLTIILSLFLFNESLGILQIIGIIVVMLAINLIHKDSKKKKDYLKKRLGFIIAFLAIIPGVGMEIINKYAAINTDLSFFILITYMFAVMIGLASYGGNHQGKLKESIKLGILIGIVNFVGYVCLLSALKTGPLSVISPMTSCYVIITVVLSWLVYKEEMKWYQFGMVLLVILGVILLKVG